MNIPYKVGDRILQHPLGNAHYAREVIVTAKHKNVKNGQPGFDGISEGVDVWGYNYEVMKVIISAKTRANARVVDPYIFMD